MTTNSYVDEGEPRGVEAPARPYESSGSVGAVLAVVALGGGLGALARYGVSLWLPVGDGGFPWPTFAVNVVGCLLIGVLMVLTTEARSTPRLLRPFLGTGVLGGFTTFSAYTVEIDDLLRSGSAPVGLAYLVGTVVCALLAVLVGTAGTRRAIGAVRARKAVAA